jgi:hypothetical protein
VRITQNISQKQSFTKIYWRKVRYALQLVRAAVMERSGETDPDRLKDMVHRLLDPKPMEELIMALWGRVAGKSAYDTEKLFGSKGLKSYMEVKTDPSRLVYWNERSKLYAARRVTAKVEKILSTQEQIINGIIDDVIETSMTQGLGIVQTRSLLISAAHRH